MKREIFGMKLRGARILIEELIRQGVDTVFGYPGGAVLNIYDELYQCRDRIHHVLTAHELLMPQTVLQEQAERSVS